MNAKKAKSKVYLVKIIVIVILVMMVPGVCRDKVKAVVPLSIATTSPLPDGQVGVPYTAKLQAAGGIEGNCHWTTTAGSFPNGLELEYYVASQFDHTHIKGTPTAAGTYTFTVSVVDDNHKSSNKEFTITIKGNSSTEAATESIGGASPCSHVCEWVTEKEPTAL